MQWFKSLFGIKDAEPLEEAEVVTQIAEMLGQFEGEVLAKQGVAEDNLSLLYPITDERKSKARHILDVVRKLRSHREVTMAAREAIEKLKSFVPKSECAVFDVDELVTKVKVTYVTPRGVSIELHSRSKSAASIEELLLDTQEYFGQFLKVE